MTMTNGEFVAWASAEPSTAAIAFLRQAQSIASRAAAARHRSLDDADEAASVTWMRAAESDWSRLRKNPTRPLLATIRRFVDNVLREADREAKRVSAAGGMDLSELDSRPITRSSLDAVSADVRLPPMTRKQRSALRRVRMGETIECIALSLAITPRSLRARLERVARTADDPDRWRRGHQSLDIPRPPLAALRRLTARQRELLRRSHGPRVTRRSLARRLGVSEETVRKMLAAIRKSLADKE